MRVPIAIRRTCAFERGASPSTIGLLRWGCCVAVMLAAVGCEKSAAPVAPAASTTGATQLVDVVLALNWHPEAEHGGFYAALVHGYYKDEGLNVTIRPGGPGVRVVPDVASGAVAFGVDNADKLLTWRAQQADAVAVMSPIQNSPRCIMVHQQSGLKKLEDLATMRPLTLAINTDQPFAQYLKRRVDLTDVQIVKYRNVLQFLEQADFGQQAYSFSEPFLAEQKGGDPLCLMLSDLGFNTYTSMLITRRELIEKQPDLVAKMTRASIRGWRKYLAEPADTNHHIHEQNPEMSLEVLQFGVEALKPLCLPDGVASERFGEMSDERWQTLVEQMVEIGSIKPDAVNAREAYTTQFLKAGGG